jgi:hypothetical protein
LKFAPSNEYKRFFEECPLVTSNLYVYVEEKKKQFLREEKPEGHFVLPIPQKETRFILEYFLSRELDIIFGLGGYVNRKGEPRPSLRVWMDQLILEIKGLEEEGKRPGGDGHGEKGGEE